MMLSRNSGWYIILLTTTARIIANIRHMSWSSARRTLRICLSAAKYHLATAVTRVVTRHGNIIIEVDAKIQNIRDQQDRCRSLFSRLFQRGA